jgi:hypothetical protein
MQQVAVLAWKKKKKKKHSKRKRKTSQHRKVLDF